jgi:seryl-tRNA synthetase
MLTTKYVRDNAEAIRKSLGKRKSDYPLDRLLDLDREWRSAKAELQVLQEKRNKASLEISESKKKGGDISGMVKALGEVKKGIEAMEKKLPEMQSEIDKILWNMPNVLHDAVPYGESSEQNVAIRKWGEIPKKSSKGHEEILTKLGMLDVERAAKVAGARFYYLKGDMVLLEQSLMRFALDLLSKKGYTIVSPPYMLKKKYYRGVTALGDFEDALYRIGDPKEVEAKDGYERVEDDLFLISTSEHPMAAMHAEETFSGNQLPLRYAGMSMCFRREAGAHGKDTKGMFRVHQFNKIEQFIFAKQDNSWDYFGEMLGNAEELLQKLKLPYRVVEICTGDIGTVAARKNDIEAWMPSQGDYREVVSCSNCTDWQSIRLDIKYDDKGERKYVHTLNSTAIATQRTLVAIVENYSNDDGTITVPEALVPYMGKKIIGKP